MLSWNWFELTRKSISFRVTAEVIWRGGINVHINISYGVAVFWDLIHAPEILYMEDRAWIWTIKPVSSFTVKP